MEEKPSHFRFLVPPVFGSREDYVLVDDSFPATLPGQSPTVSAVRVPVTSLASTTRHVLTTQ